MFDDRLIQVEGAVPGGQVRTTAGRPVARLIAPVFFRVGILVGVMALVAVIGVVLSTRSVNHLTEDLQPSAAASQDILQDLTDLEAAVGAWERSGQASAVDDYRQSLARLLGHEQ